MAISTFSSYINKILSPYQIITSFKGGISQGNRLNSLWLATPNAGLTPALAETCSNLTTGSLGQNNSNGIQRISRANIYGGLGCQMILCDRLVHMGGLDGTSTGSQVVNTVTLPRYTNGVGVSIAVEVYTSIGGTATTISASYTNEQGQAGRFTPASVFGGTGFGSNSHAVIILPLAQGDVGVKSVESVTVAASTGIVGNFGIVLFKPLFNMAGLIGDDGQMQIFDSILGGCGNMPQILNQACLYQIIRPGINSSPNPIIEMTFIEEW